MNIKRAKQEIKDTIEAYLLNGIHQRGQVDHYEHARKERCC